MEKTDKVKVVSKGYTLHIQWYECEGDVPQTTTVVTDNVRDAELYSRLCNELFEGYSDGKCIGGLNCNGTDLERAHDRIEAWVRANVQILPGGELKDGDKLGDNEVAFYTGFIMGINSKLLGDSEYFYSRTFDTMKVTYSASDVYVTSCLMFNSEK